jgi:hypothetical protein
MTPDQVAVLFIAGRHSFAGAMDHNRARVLDGLNSASTEFLQVHGASIFRGLWDGPTEQFDTITVPKSSIDCVVLTEERHEAPLQRKYALVEKPSHSAFVLLEQYEIRGKLMIGRNFEPITLLNGGASHFFPLVAATISSVESNVPTLSAQVAFVNKTKVSLLQIDDRPNTAGR